MDFADDTPEVFVVFAVFAPVVWSRPKASAGRITVAINASLWTFVSLFRLLEEMLFCAALGRDKKSIDEATARTIALGSLIEFSPNVLRGGATHGRAPSRMVG